VGKNTVINIKQRFGQAMRQRRREMDISQEELADRAGLHRTYISDVERGDRNLSLENIEKITQALELKISEFFAQCES
jgi:transcriptional regulator with XRE-family HTH domain